MLPSSSNPEERVVVKPTRRWWMVVVYPLWVLGGLATANVMLGVIIAGLRMLQVPIDSINENLLNTIASALIYVLTLLIVLGVPMLMKKLRASREELGLTRLPTWTDIWMAPAGLIVYFILSLLLITAATSLFPTFDAEQVQEIGFNQLTMRYEYILAFLTLVVIAPIVEEIIFRGYLFGKLRRVVPVWVAILVTSLVFGALHGNWNVVIDTFTLSVILCVLRITTGSLIAPILVHMMKNGIAFYFLFINPNILNTLG